MATLVSAVADALAALLRAVGVVGTPRRREGIHKDLQLLKELEAQPAFEHGSRAHSLLTGRINREIEFLCGQKGTKRKANWGASALSTVIWASFGYLTWRLDRDGFVWYSIFPLIVAGLFLVASIGLLRELEEGSEQTEDSPDVVSSAD
jgi:hypothetical protein